jgi:hypothetical protein
VDVFLKNTAVGDVMFREVHNFKKSYNYGDIPPVYTADIIHNTSTSFNHKQLLTTAFIS